MKLKARWTSAAGRMASAFSVPEVIVGMGVVGVTFVALYAGINSGFYTIQLTRDDIRATQIIADKLDTIRLYAWDTVIQPGFVPTNFVESFYPTSVTNGAGYSSPGVTYSGSVSITAAPLTESYSTN